MSSEFSDEFLRSVGGVKIVQGNEPPQWFFGWIPRKAPIEGLLYGIEIPDFSSSTPELVGSGKGKTVLLYEAARQVMGRDLDPGPQQIGDCVGWGFSGCLDLLACVEVLAGQPETYSWDMRASPEAIYALSRVEYGDKGGSDSDGSTGLWAKTALINGGSLSRNIVGAYSGMRAREWGSSGLPDEYEEEAKKHRIRHAAQVRSYEAARDAISNGYPIAVCSDQGFEGNRDQDGFITANGQWAHCMKFVACKDDERPGLLCMNSWGSHNPPGPTGKYDIPSNSWWVDAATCTKMLKQEDSYAIGRFDGYSNRIALMEKLGLAIS